MQVVTSITKCGENSSEAVQLAVIRALLTITTAEHFVAHGESLMQAVRRHLFLIASFFHPLVSLLFILVGIHPVAGPGRAYRQVPTACLPSTGVASH